MDANVYWVVGVVLAAVVTGIASLFRKRSKSDTDSTSQDSHVDINMLVDTAMGGMKREIDLLKVRVKALEKQETSLRAEIAGLEKWKDAAMLRIQQLEKWVRAQGVDPEHVVEGLLPPIPLD